MIIGSAPLRVSLLGGGSDVPSFFNNGVGAVLGGSINLRVYVCVINMALSAEYPFRFTYRQVDNANTKMEIEHPVWRKLLESRSDISRLNAATFSDVPGNSGLGSSSSFTVAAISALDLYLGEGIDANRISREAIQVERDELGEPGGWQDQLHAAHGGFRLYTFNDGEVNVGNELLTADERKLLNESSILVKIGESRNSAEFHALTMERNANKIRKDLECQAQLAFQGADILSSNAIWSSKFKSISELLLENWRIKRSVSNRSSEGIDELIAFGLKNGAMSAKLCGAGGSGYVLFLGQPDGILNLRTKVEMKSVVDFEFGSKGVESISV